jgi:fatty-acyl-CoA synthase
MEGYPSNTTTILEYGNSVHRNKKNNNHLPDGTREEYRFGICINDEVS